MSERNLCLESGCDRAVCCKNVCIPFTSLEEAHTYFPGAVPIESVQQKPPQDSVPVVYIKKDDEYWLFIHGDCQHYDKQIAGCGRYSNRPSACRTFKFKGSGCARMRIREGLRPVNGSRKDFGLVVAEILDTTMVRPTEWTWAQVHTLLNAIKASNSRRFR